MFNIYLVYTCKMENGKKNEKRKTKKRNIKTTRNLGQKKTNTIERKNENSTKNWNTFRDRTTAVTTRT